MNKQRKTSHILNVFQYDHATGIIGLNGAPVSGYGLYLTTNINDGSVGIDSSASINALYLLKNTTKQFEISYDTSGATKIFRLLPYQSGSFFQIGNPSNAANSNSDYVFISEATYGNVLIGPGIGNAVSNLTGATASIHKVQFNGAVFANNSIQATSFKITGGASTGFLKADGTVDTVTYLSGNQSITVSGDATGSGTTSIALTLANTAVTPGTYGSTTLVPVVTVDSKGRITSVTTAAISGSLTFTGDVTGSGTTGTSTAMTLAASGVTAGTYTKVTVDSKGRVTVGASATTSDISEGTNLYYTDARVLSYLSANTYATQSYVNTQVSNLVAAAPATLDTLNELAAALGNDPSFATTISTALGNRLRVDINNQGLSGTLQGYGRTNLGLGTAATSNTGDFVAYRTFGTAANSAIGDFVAYRTFGTAANNNTGDFATAAQGTKADTAFGWGNHASAGYLTSATAATTYVSLTGSYANPAWITSLGWSKITSTPTTISGYGITNAYTDAQIQNFFNGANAITGYNKSNWDTAYSWGNHAVAGYLTTASAASTYVSLTGSYANPSWITSLAYSKITGVPAFLTSYTETDPYRVTTVAVSGTSTKTITLTRADASTVTTTWTDYDTDTNTYVTSAGFSGGNLTLTRNDTGQITVSLDGRYYLATNPSQYITGISFANVSSKPTTISGYGITDAITTGNIASQSVSYASSTNLLNSLSNYVWSASTLPSGYNAGIQTSFVSASEGFPSYGSVLTNRTYTGSEGGTLQLFTPYGPAYGGTRLGFRSGIYETGAWSGWKYLLNDSSDPYAANMNQYVRTTDNVNFNTVTISGKITTAVTNGTIISHGSMTDAFGYNNSYGTYIGSAVGGTYYIYGNGQMYNNGTIVTLLHSSNYSSYALPLSGGTLSNTLNIGSGGSTNASLLNITGGTHNQVNITNGSGWGLLLGYCNEGSVSAYHGPYSAALINVQDGPLHLGTGNSSRAVVTQYGQLLINAASSGYGSNLYGYNLGMRGNSTQAYISVALSGQTLDTQGLIIGLDTTAARFHVRDSKTIIFANADVERMTLDTSANLVVNGSVRAPIFYDTNDTAYYLNPAGGSRLRNLYVGDSGDDWSDPGGWGTQVRFSNGPHVRFVLHARTPGIEAGMYVHTPSSVYIGSYTSHDVSMMYAGNRKMQITNSYIYTDVYLEAAGSLRAPIFYDSNDTSYYLDPNSTSNLYAVRAYQYQGNGNVAGTGNASYHPSGIYSTGTNWLYGTMYMNNNSIRDVQEVYNNGWFRTVNHQGLHNPTNDAHFYPNNASYGSWRIDGTRNGWHGLHFASGSTLMMNSNETGVHREGYGWQWRWDNGTFYIHGNSYGGGTGYAVITAGNIGSQSVSYASSAGSVAWTNVSGRPTAVSSFSNDSGYVTSGGEINRSYRGIIQDTRGGQRSPNDYDDYRVSWEFTNQIVSGWHSVMTLQGWHDGYAAWQIIGPSDSAHENWYLRSGNNTSWNSLRSIIHSGNISSQTVSNSDMVDGYHASNFLGYNGNSYYQVNSWLQMNGTHGIYYPSYNGAHFYVNTTSSYTQFRLDGSRGGYGGIWDSYSAVHGIMYDSAGNGGVYREANGRWYWYHHIGNNCTGISTSTTSSSYRAYIGGALYAEGDIVAYSDVRKKTDIITIDNALNKVINLRGVYYTRIDDPQRGRQTGVIAQEINEVLPEVVTYASDLDEYGVSYGNIVGVLIEAIKEQQLQIEELKNKLDNVLSSR